MDAVEHEAIKVVVTFAWIVCAVYSAVLAGAKGYSDGWWLWWGVLFGPLTFLATMGLPDRRGEQS